MGYYRLADGDARQAMEEALTCLRRLTALHTDTAAGDAEEA